MRQLWGGVALAILGGCAVYPTAEEQAAADYGPEPDWYTCRAAIRILIQGVLKDPGSAEFRWYGFERAWWGSRGLFGPGITYGWRMAVDVNAKNSFGAYTGYETWWFYFRDGKIADITEPRR